MRRATAIVGLLAAAALIAAAAAGPLMSQVEEPPYTVALTAEPFEIRAYPAMIVATVTVDGSRSSAIQQGFRALADYIFGANSAAKKIAMTAPVMQERGAPASPDPTPARHEWTVRFVMPRSSTLDSLPKPLNQRVELRKMPAAKFAVIRFSGFWRDATLKRRTEELQAFVAREHMIARGAPVYAFYNPPWTLPFLRRNEVMIEVAPKAS